MGKKVKGNTKGGKFVNPTDRARKEERKRELKKNKKQRLAVRAAVIKGKDPQQILTDMERLDQMEFNINEPCPLNETVLSNKRRKLMETWDRIVKVYIKEDKDKYLQLKRLEADYDRKRNEMKKNFQAVKSAENVNLEEIPLPCLPEGPPSASGLKAPSLTVHRIVTDKEPPGPPPGPLPCLDEFDDDDDSPGTKRLKTGADHDVDAFLKEIEDVAVIPNPSSSVIPSVPAVIASQIMLRPPVVAASGGVMIPPPNLPDFRPPLTGHFPPRSSFPQNRPPLHHQRIPGPGQPDPKHLHTEKSKQGATIEAKPQLRNLSLDATRFIPTSLRLKRNEKQTAKPSIVSRPTAPTTSATTTTPATSEKSKDDAYEQFMKELQGLI